MILTIPLSKSQAVSTATLEAINKNTMNTWDGQGMTLDMFGNYVQHDKYHVTPITYGQTEPFILNIHYAKRMPSITHAYGLFEENKLVGVITYGSPPSPTLSASIAGETNKHLVLELNRLVLKNNKKNEASVLVSASFKLLPKPKIIVSFADEEKGHMGTIYQATNFIYTGSTTNETEFIDKDGNDFHYRNIGHLQKNNALNVSLVKVRKNEHLINRVDVALFLKEYKGGFKNKELDLMFGTKDTAAHWFRTDKGFSFPSIDNWQKLKGILEFPDVYDEVMADYELVPSRQEIIDALGLREKKIKPKHRYVYFVGNKTARKQLKKEFRYEAKAYPKKESQEHYL